MKNCHFCSYSEVKTAVVQRFLVCVGVLQVNEQVQAVVVMSNAQSQMSVETADNYCQMAPDVADGVMQTERHDVHTEAQTESSIAWRADHEVQAVVAISESAVQASAPVNAIDCQTDSSMANLLSRYVQASMDLTCSDSQTDLSQSDSEAQTEVCLHLFTLSLQKLHITDFCIFCVFHSVIIQQQ